MIGNRVKRKYTSFHGSLVMRIRKTGKIKQAVLLMTLAAVLLSIPFAAAQAAIKEKNA